MLPNVNITLGNGNLGRITPTTDGVSALLLTGVAIPGKLELLKHYLLSSTNDLVALGVTGDNNFLIDKDVRAFYAQTGEGAELHLLVVSEATTLTAMCSTDATSPLNKLINSAGGRIRLVGANKLPPTSYTAVVTQGIDGDAITAGAAANAAAEAHADKVKPFRSLLPACNFTGETETLFKPSASSHNRVGYVIASDDNVKKTAAIGQVLGRAAKIAVHRSIGRVKDGAIAAEGWLTNGAEFQSAQGLSGVLNDAGYITYVKYPTKNGCYLSGDPMASSVTDDYSELHLGRVVDKACTIIYDTYITEIMDNIKIESDGKLSAAICMYYEGVIENAISVVLNGEISSFDCFVDPNQNVLSSGALDVSGAIVPQGVLKSINFGLTLKNPAIIK
ncbi:MAG: DUF2586 family protein [Rikenellaceae bacterium]